MPPLNFDATKIIPFPAAPISSPTEQLRDQMAGAGIEAPAMFHWDGQIHRFPTKDGHDDAGWYVLFDGEVPAGAFGDWRLGNSNTFVANIGRKLSWIEEQENRRRVEESRKRYEEERKLKNERAAETCETIWKEATTASADHPYLRTKGIGVHISRVAGDGRLIVPLFDAEGNLSTIQYIDATGGKLYHPGGATKGRYATLGEIGQRVYIAEGFATGATIYEATGTATVVAYSAGNLEPVTASIRTLHPTTEIIIVADNDASGIGKNHAEQAAAKHGAKVVMPPDRGDANDYRLAGGDLFALLTPAPDEWLVNAFDFAQQPAPIRWLVKRWVQAEALIMVHGKSGSGKTFLVLDWCLRMASGQTSWIGGKVKPASVVYLAGEGHHGLRSRIAGWMHHHNATGPLDLWISRSGCDLDEPTGLIGAITQIRHVKRPDLIVVDTLHRFLSGDENSAQDARAMLESCAKLQQEFGCSVLLVHHTGVSEETQHRLRGSSAWRGALDIEVSVLPPQKDGDPITVNQMKSKDAELSPPVYINLHQVTIPGWIDEDGGAVTTAVITSAQPVEKVDEKKNRDKSVIMGAWLASNKLVENHFPYLSKDDFINFLVDTKEAETRDAARKQVANDKGRMAYRMVSSGIISPHLSGYRIVDPELSYQLLNPQEDEE